MSDHSILRDYQNDWIARSLNVKGVDYSAFDHLTICVALFKDSLIASILAEIIAGIEIKYHINIKLLFVSEHDAIPEDSVLVIAQDAMLGGGIIPHTENCEVYCICNAINDADRYAHGRVLYCGTLYAAGADFPEMKVTENDCTNLLDLFGALIFLISNRKKLGAGIYYAGHGQAKVSSIQLVACGYQPMITYEDGKYMLEFFYTRPEERFYFDNTYGGKLKLLQSLLLDLLKEFDRICQKYKIQYFLGGGTLLGAIRHEGIIPWDDDIDVMMLRPDYEKFLAVVNKELPDSVFFQSSETDEEYHSIFTKLRLNHTKFVTRYSSQFQKMNQGIFIDIFVHDKTANSKLGQKKHVFKTLFVRSMVFHKWADTPMHFYGKFKILCSLATSYIKRNDIKKLEKIQEKVVRSYEKKNTDFLYDGTGEHLRHGAFPAKWLKGERMAQFEGMQFPVPSHAEEYLKYSYRDYEKWIPASLRKAGHDIVEVDFGPYNR